MTDTLGFPRWTKDITFTGGSWESAWPVTNLRDLPFNRVARSTDVFPAQTQFRGTFSQARLIEIVTLCRHNLSLDAKWRIRVYEAASDVAFIYDSGWIDVWPEVYDEDEVTWDAGNFWDRKYTDEEIAGHPWHAAHFIPGDITAEAFTVEIDDEGNQDGYVQIGLCEVASALDLPLTPAFGAQLGFLSRTAVTEADSGVEAFERRAKPRTFTGTIAAIARSTALSKFQEMQRQHDVDLPFFWWPDRENPKNALRTAYLARFAQLDPLTQAYTAHDTLTLSLREIL